MPEQDDWTVSIDITNSGAIKVETNQAGLIFLEPLGDFIKRNLDEPDLSHFDCDDIEECMDLFEKNLTDALEFVKFRRSEWAALKASKSQNGR